VYNGADPDSQNGDVDQNGWTPMRRLGTPADIGHAVTLPPAPITLD